MIKITAVFFVCFVLLGIAQPAFADRAIIVLSDEVQLKLGDAFSSEGEYYRAITEYKKLLILFPDSPHADFALFKIGMSYYHGEEYEQAVQTFASFRKKFPASSHTYAVSYQQGLALVRLNLPDQASEAFAAAEAASPASASDQRKAVFGRVLAEYDRGNTDAVRIGLERFMEKHPPDDQGAKQVTTALSMLEQQQDQRSKSPLAAGILSAVVPGSGHIYSGHYGDGFTALLLNGLFIGGTLAAVKQENYPIAAVAAIIGLPFYIGNIYGAANAATKWNIAARKDLRGKLAVTLEYPFW
jgi:tetratricopeptide (TPR) repeat protein